ncbi:hypothetical protein EJ08DRAFT_696955 [Tothia fuscella]|uniref:Protein AF-9 homolog n=1 Tax=Tothia fuscella TaxID=1048955 RepID=A0A9P4TZK6_9PEZI|nr:hypothetical protein EJ08DRAFT_696955 [Tothia fuscella]
MSNKANKRVKGKKISRDFSRAPTPSYNNAIHHLIGSEAWKLTDEELKAPNIRNRDPLPHAGWRVYVRPVPGGPSLTDWLKRVTFTLHETFANPVRSVESVNPVTGGFELQETAYGGFQIIVKVYFQQYATEKQQQRQHYLLLEPYVGDADPERALHERERLWKAGGGICRSETVEVIEFNEPTELLFDALTSNTQWDYLQAKSKGKGRAGYSVADNEDRIVGEPPANAEPGSLWSKEHEDALVETLRKMGDQCDEQLKKTLERSLELNQANGQMKEGAAIDEKLLALYESLPPKKK